MSLFTIPTSVERARSFYGDVKARVVAEGRAATALKILPSINPIVGATAAEAAEKFAFLQSKVHPRCRARAAGR